jgi:hypothetical protein
MGKPPAESMPQREFLHQLRAAIDIARKHPTPANISKAQQLAYGHPQAMRSSHVSHNLGASRWEWLGNHQVTIIGEEVEIAGNPAKKMTITPEVKK